METKELRIEIPEGYEIDKEKSKFVFKKITRVNSWNDLNIVSGYFIGNCSSIMPYYGDEAINEHKNIFLNEKYAKSALALAQISQLLPYYDTNVNWNNFQKPKYVFVRLDDKIEISLFYTSYHILAFNSHSEAERFLKYNESLVKDFFML